MKNNLGDAPIEPEYFERMNKIAMTLDIIFNKDKLDRKIGFVLLIFPFGEKDGHCNYISNGANRKDIIKLFQEQIKRFGEFSNKEN